MKNDQSLLATDDSLEWLRFEAGVDRRRRATNAEKQDERLLMFHRPSLNEVVVIRQITTEERDERKRVICKMHACISFNWSHTYSTWLSWKEGEELTTRRNISSYWFSCYSWVGTSALIISKIIPMNHRRHVFVSAHRSRSDHDKENRCWLFSTHMDDEEIRSVVSSFSV